MLTILIIEDEADIRELLRYNLEKEGYSVMEAVDGEEGWEKALASQPDLILLDLMLPGCSGWELCRLLRSREQTAAVPIIIVTAKSQEEDKILGLELGADDYVTKPFSPRELLARVRAVLRRREGLQEKAAVLRHKGLELNLKTCVLLTEEMPVELTAREFKLLEFLMKNKGRVYSRDQLLDKVWGYEAAVESKTVDVHIRRLREKIEKNPQKPLYILTLRGLGYKFSEEIK